MILTLIKLNDLRSGLSNRLQDSTNLKTHNPRDMSSGAKLGVVNCAGQLCVENIPLHWSKLAQISVVSG